MELNDDDYRRLEELIDDEFGHVSYRKGNETLHFDYSVEETGHLEGGSRLEEPSYTVDSRMLSVDGIFAEDEDGEESIPSLDTDRLGKNINILEYEYED